MKSTSLSKHTDVFSESQTISPFWVNGCSLIAPIFGWLLQTTLMDTTTLPIEYIEGIGPARKAELEAVGIHFVCELLLVPPRALAASTGLSMERIQDWRTAALFLELDTMNAQWAEALTRNKVYDLAHIAHLSLEQLGEKFDQAVEDNLINEIPDTETVAAMKVEAAQHHYGSQLQGVVTNEAFEPVEGATVSCGSREAMSNAKGLWKITGLSFRESPPVFIRKEGFQTQYVENANLDVDVWSTALMTTVLAEGSSEALVWDEYKGDTLPPLISYKTKQLILGEADIRPKDIIKVTERYANGDIKTISIFRSMTDNQLNIHCYRIAADAFNGAPEIGTYWAPGSSGLQDLGVGDESVLMLRELHHAPPPSYDPSLPWTQFFTSSSVRT